MLFEEFSREDSQLKQHLSDCRLVAAKKTITAFKTQLEKAHCDLVNSEKKAASLHLKLDVAKQKLM